jgi:mono/diheme cytochrome c family protein
MKFWASSLNLCSVLLSGAIILAQSSKPKNQTSSSGTSTQAATGQAVYNANCALCHYDSSEAQKMGPGLKGIYKRRKFASGKRVDDTAVIRLIQNGGKGMPPMKDKLSADQMRALIEYLKSI